MANVLILIKSVGIAAIPLLFWCRQCIKAFAFAKAHAKSKLIGQGLYDNVFPNARRSLTNKDF